MRSAPSLSVPAAVGFVAVTPVAVWAAVGKHDDGGDDFAAGPFHVPLVLEAAIGVAAVVVLVACIVSVARRHTVPDKVGITPVLLLCLITAAYAIAGRMLTAGVTGANIGAGALLLALPVLTAGLLVAAILTQHGFRPLPRTVLAAALVVAGATAPVLYATVLG